MSDEPSNTDDLLTRRLTYAREVLDEASVAPDPFAQFGHWIAEALATPGIIEPNAMSPYRDTRP